MALSTGLQAALWAVGGVLEEHRTDSLSAAFDNLAEQKAQHVRGAYEGLRIAVPPARWPDLAPQDSDRVMQRLLALARCIIPWQVATNKRAPKIENPKGWVAGAKARTHVCAARVLKAAAKQRP